MNLVSYILLPTIRYIPFLHPLPFRPCSLPLGNGRHPRSYMCILQPGFLMLEGSVLLPVPFRTPILLWSSVPLFWEITSCFTDFFMFLVFQVMLFLISPTTDFPQVRSIFRNGFLIFDGSFLKSFSNPRKSAFFIVTAIDLTPYLVPVWNIKYMIDIYDRNLTYIRADHGHRSI